MSRQTLDFYPFQMQIATRYADVDTQRHINNVRLAEMYQESRVVFISSSFEASKMPKNRKVLADLHIAYHAEAHYGDPLDFGVGIGKIGNSSLTLVSAAFQFDQCISTSESVLVFLTAEGISKRIPDRVRDALAPYQVAIRGR